MPVVVGLLHQQQSALKKAIDFRFFGQTSKYLPFDRLSRNNFFCRINQWLRRWSILADGGKTAPRSW
ncbi:MAG: hypothetical protein RR311_07240 [Comamonas sp.]